MRIIIRIIVGIVDSWAVEGCGLAKTPNIISPSVIGTHLYAMPHWLFLGVVVIRAGEYTSEGYHITKGILGNWANSHTSLCQIVTELELGDWIIGAGAHIDAHSVASLQVPVKVCWAGCHASFRDIICIVLPKTRHDTGIRAEINASALTCDNLRPCLIGALPGLHTSIVQSLPKCRDGP